MSDIEKEREALQAPAQPTPSVDEAIERVMGLGDALAQHVKDYGWSDDIPERAALRAAVEALGRGAK